MEHRSVEAVAIVALPLGGHPDGMAARGAIAAPPEAWDRAATAGVAVAFATGFGGGVTAYGV
ncbi:hypothetical protein [Streptomyces sp. NPDC002676]